MLQSKTMSAICSPIHVCYVPLFVRPSVHWFDIKCIYSCEHYNEGPCSHHWTYCSVQY